MQPPTLRRHTAQVDGEASQVLAMRTWEKPWGKAMGKSTGEPCLKYLVGGIPTHLKNMSSSVKIIIPNMMGKKMFQTTNRYLLVKNLIFFVVNHGKKHGKKVVSPRNIVILMGSGGI